MAEHGMEHLQIAKNAAKKYCRKWPHRSEDILQESIFGLLQGLKWAGEKNYPAEYLPRYLTVTCKRFIRDYLEHDSLVPVPRKTFVKNAASGIVPLVSSIVKYDEEGEEYETGSNEPAVRATAEDEAILAETLERITKGDGVNEAIVMLLEHGYTLEQAGAQLGMTKQAAHHRLQKMRESVRL